MSNSKRQAADKHAMFNLELKKVLKRLFKQLETEQISLFRWCNNLLHIMSQIQAISDLLK